MTEGKKLYLVEASSIGNEEWFVVLKKNSKEITPELEGQIKEDILEKRTEMELSDKWDFEDDMDETVWIIREVFQKLRDFHG